MSHIQSYDMGKHVQNILFLLQKEIVEIVYGANIKDHINVIFQILIGVIYN